MKLLPMLLAFMLQACEPYSEDNHGAGWNYDFETPSGIQYRLDAGTTTFTAQEIDENMLWVRECMSMPAGGKEDLMVIVVSPEKIRELRGNGTTPNGTYFSSPSLILLKAGYDKNEDFRVNHSMKHEMTHHVLKTYTGWPDSEHNNPVARDCIIGYD